VKTVSVTIADLSQDPANARKHDDKNIDSIIASLRRFGQQKPIVIDASNVVRAGNGTLEAAKRLGWDSIECVKTDLKGSDAIAYAIADNRTAELAEWDSDILAAQLSGLLTDDEALANAAGFSAEEIEAMLGDLADPTEIDEDEVPEPPVDPITKLGDLWILGEHRVLCGDSTKAEDVARLMGGKRADLLLTDPPYGIGYAGSMKLGQERFGWKQYQGGWDETRPADKTILDAVGRCAQAIIWGGNFFPCLPVSAGWLIWNKVQRNFSMGEGELAWTSFLNSVRIFDLSRGSCVSDGKQHPTQKAIALIVWCLGFAEDAKLIHDPFLGSGTTLIAAEQLGRKCYGMEISPQYCDVIVARWEKLTGQKAVLEGAA
jgi:ParB-like chromosome segregation protein Spo0J